MSTDFVYKDYTPANARVIVSYSKGEKVRFSYPQKFRYGQAVRRFVYPMIFEGWLIITLLLSFPFVLILLLSIPIEYHIYLLWGIFHILIFPLIITLIISLNKEFCSTFVPKLGYWMSRFNLKYKEFTKKDVTNKKCVIPYFENGYLHYKANGDFDKYLQKIEILEHPFEYIDSLGEKEKNYFTFRAVFYFSKTPKNGCLKVEFV